MKCVILKILVASGLRVQVDNTGVIDVLITFPSKYNNAAFGGMCDWNDWPNHNGERYRLETADEKQITLK